MIKEADLEVAVQREGCSGPEGALFALRNVFLRLDHVPSDEVIKRIELLLQKSGTPQQPDPAQIYS